MKWIFKYCHKYGWHWKILSPIIHNNIRIYMVVFPFTRCFINCNILNLYMIKTFKYKYNNAHLFWYGNWSMCPQFRPLIWKFRKEKKEEIWLSPMTKAHTPTEMSKGQSDNINNATKKFDYTAVADRLRTVSWSNYSHPTGVVNRFTGPPSH